MAETSHLGVFSAHAHDDVCQTTVVPDFSVSRLRRVRSRAMSCSHRFFFFFTHRLRDWLDHLPFGMIDFVRRKSERLDCGACSVPPHTQTRSLIVSPSLVHNRLDIVLTRGRDRPVIRARIDPAGLRLGSSVIHSCSGEFSSLTFGS